VRGGAAGLVWAAVSPHIRWAGLTPKAGRYPTLRGRKISRYVILVAKSLPAFCPRVERGDEWAWLRVQADFATHIN